MFSNLKEELNTLPKHDVPRLRELCMQHSYRFQAFDLYQGITEEQKAEVRFKQLVNECRC